VQSIRDAKVEAFCSQCPQLMLIASLIFLSAGCGDASLKTYSVEGRVVYDDGSPVQGGIVSFETDQRNAADGEPNIINATGTVEADGSFRLITNRQFEGAVAGVHRVAVSEAPSTASDFDAMQKSSRQMIAIPRKYASFDTSGLTAKVEPKANSITITVKRR
jgi:hypothetical protein